MLDCHGAHTREEQEHGDEDVNSNIQSLMKSRQDKAGLRDRIHREETSRPDEIKLKRQD